MLKSPHAGCDAYYFMLCREEFLKHKKIPIVLPPYYVLEYQEQWYPPGFTIFLALFPQKFLDKYYWCISPAVDTMICAALFVFILTYTHNLERAILGSFLYLLSPAAIPETWNLTSRQLGSLFLNLAIVPAIFYALIPHWGLLCLSISAGTLLLLTHKLSAQAFYPGLLLMALLTWNLRFFTVVIATILAALIFSKGFYLKIARSHLDYIRYWSEHWRTMGGHQVHDSLLYKTIETDASFVYAPGNPFPVAFLKEYLYRNFYLLIPLAALWDVLTGGTLRMEEIYFSLWTILVLIIGLLSYLVPQLRSIGFALQYGKLALPGGMICAALALQDPIRQFSVYLVLFYMLRQSLLGYLPNILVQESRKSLFQWDISGMEPMFQYIRSQSASVFMCLPHDYCDILAYYCRIPVLWGGHTSPAANITIIHPVLTETIEHICHTYQITHLLLDIRYASPEQLRITAAPCWSNEHFNIYEAKDILS